MLPASLKELRIKFKPKSIKTFGIEKSLDIKLSKIWRPKMTRNSLIDFDHGNPINKLGQSAPKTLKTKDLWP